ncbi:MAG: putative manganese-dependent inorganic diphosphatase [Parasporobacterium sp.]|nr:putative manganese-dependent inorganic diphosphatase [Parasporobacterium sp.]
MDNVFITGHRNPDMDSVCSAYAYAKLKNSIDKNHNYIAVRCGHLSDSLKQQFEMLGITPPPYMGDVHPKVGDVMLVPEKRLNSTQPIYDLIRFYDESLPSALPVFDGDEFHGLLTIDDITAWFLSDGMANYPEYNFRVSNMAEVIDGRIIHNNGTDMVHGALVMGILEFENYISSMNRVNVPIAVMPYNDEYIAMAIENKVPVIVISACQNDVESDFSEYPGCVMVTSMDTSETLRRLRMAPDVSNLVGTQGPSLHKDDLYEDAKELLAASKLRGLSVFDGDEWVGFVTRRCFLRKPTYKVIMMDHNEVGQSIRGIEEAEVREIIDHHRLDALKTELPIFIDSEPLGSTCTIVYQQYLRHNIFPDQDTAKMLLAGIMSDTLILRSPTTTAIDRTSAGSLAAICGELDIAAFGRKMFSTNNTLASRDPVKAINSDFKVYTKGDLSVGIGQCEATTLDDIDEYSEKYLEALEDVRQSAKLDWAVLMITDVLVGNSILLATSFKRNDDLSYQKISDCIFDMPGVVSRKKQLLPEILHALGL